METLDAVSGQPVIDRVAVKDLNFGVGKSALYKRFSHLGIVPEKSGRQSFISGDEYQLLEALDNHLSTGGVMAEFQPDGRIVEPVRNDAPAPSSAFDLAIANDAPAPVQQMAALMAAMASTQKPADPLAGLRSLQEACDNDWRLNSSQVAELLGRKSLPSSPFESFGFKFERCGRNGRESAWRISKVK